MIRGDERYWAEMVLDVIDNVERPMLMYEGEKMIVRKALKAYIKNNDTADTPQTDCDKCIWSVCNYNKVDWDADTPQTDRPCDKCEWHKEYGRCIFEYCHYEYEQAHKDTPQTDCGWR